jgi:hypothetical protein
MFPDKICLIFEVVDGLDIDVDAELDPPASSSNAFAALACAAIHSKNQGYARSLLGISKVTSNLR